MTPQQANELLPCPFCGGEALIQEHEAHSHAGGLAAFMPDYPGSFTLECMGKDCNTGLIADTRAEVVTMWNRRAPAPTSEPGARDLFETGYADVYRSTPGGGWNDRVFGTDEYAEIDVQDAWRLWKTCTALATPASPAVPTDQLWVIATPRPVQGAGDDGWNFSVVPAVPSVQQHAALQELADQAQELDMGYGSADPAPLVAQASPVMYQQRMVAPNGHTGPWSESTAEMYARYKKNNDIGDGFKYEVRAQTVVEDAQRIVAGKVEPTCTCPSGDGSLRWPFPQHPPELDPVVEANREMLHQRSQLGIKKYGGTLDAMRHSRRALMQHALEEALDLANYLQADIQAIDRERATTGNATADDGKDK